MMSMSFSRALALITFMLLRLSYATRMTEADPVTTYPEVVPGPRLPSLASLNLTSAQLYAIPNEYEGADDPDEEINPACGPSGLYISRDSILACYNYMHALDDNWICDVTSDLVYEFCKSGEGVIRGMSLSGVSEQSSCKDVAKGVAWILNSCMNNAGDVAGLAAVWGNENLLLYTGMQSDEFFTNFPDEIESSR